MISLFSSRRRLAAVAAVLITGPLVVSASPALATASPVSVNPDHIKVLTAALQNMHDNYAKFARFVPGPQDIFDYNVGNLWLNGIDGTGTTVAVIEGWDDPGIDAFIHVRDVRYGLPDPVIQTIFPSGPLPAQCPQGMVVLGSYGSCDAWVGELRLDVLSVHLMAPYAKIVISATPADSEVTDDPASNVAPPEMMRALEDISENHLANVISISDGTGESTYQYGVAQIHANDPGPLAAAAAGVPVLNATGDCGVVQNLAVANSQCGDTTPGPDSATWDDNPWTTAIGGSVPNLSTTDGSRLGPDPLWHRGIFAEGAGFSSVYPRPDYQNGVAAITGSPWRSVPDLTMDAQSGTSEAAPLMGGVLALATQLNHGQNVGPINPVLYQVLGPLGARAGIEDVVSGNNSVIDPKTGQVLVQGFTAGPGFDVASGWGTIDASTFVPTLVQATQQTGVVLTARLQAADQLRRLERNIHVSPVAVGPGGTATVTSGGFLPVHPVTLAIDGATVATLTAGTDGTVSYTLDPVALSLRPGPHTLTLHGMLITTTTQFLVG